MSLILTLPARLASSYDTHLWAAFKDDLPGLRTLACIGVGVRLQLSREAPAVSQ